MASFQISPGVLVEEQDFSGIIPSVPVNIGALVGDFQWGPVDDVTLVDSLANLEKKFGLPVDRNAKDWFVARNYLAYSQNLQLIRVVDETQSLANASDLTTLSVVDADAVFTDTGGLADDTITALAGLTSGAFDGGTVTVVSGGGSNVGKTFRITTNTATQINVVGVDGLVTVGAGATTLKLRKKVVVKNLSDFELQADVLDALTTASTATLAATANGSTSVSATREFTYPAVVSNCSAFVGGTITISDVSTAGDDGAYTIVKARTTLTSTIFTVSTNWPTGGLTALSATFAAPANTNAKFIARYPGTYGNRLSVSYADSDSFSTWYAKDEFEYAPDNTEVAVVVLSDDEVIERFLVSLVSDALDSDSQPYFVSTRINTTSNYIFVTGNFPLTNIGSTTIDLVGGQDNPDGIDLTAEKILGWDQFAAAEYLDINFCMQGGSSQTVGEYIVDNVATVRMDCVAFISPQQSAVVGNAAPEEAIVTERNLYNSSSYAFMDGNYKYQYDPYNQKYRWIPLNGDTAGLMARTSYTNDPWWSPAGLNRGHIKNVVKLAFNPSKAQRDYLYKSNVNPVTSFPSDGTVLYGDKTLLAKASAFDRINVRMLFIILEKAIAKAAKYMLFEFNDEFTRTRFIQMVEPFLRDVQGRRGIQRHKGQDGFYVIADERVNTPEVIDSNEFRATILIKPNRSINFIKLTFAATRTGVVFEELAAEITGALGSGSIR